MLHGHGNDGYQYSREIWADFSTNVWYGKEPEGMKEYIFDQWNTINSYPEVIGESFADKISRHYGLNSRQVLVVNGTTESIYLLAQLYAGKKTTILTPTFSEYEDACMAFHHTITYMPWPSDLASQPLDADLVFICNPNNPTGKIISILQLEKTIRKHPNCLFAIDEAFIEFTLFNESALKLLSRYDNLLIMRSMTKAYAIPGLRLGYILAGEQKMERLKSIKQPWTINTMALAAGHFVFDNFLKVHPPIEDLLTDKEQFVNQLKSLGFVNIFESCTHFFLCQIVHPDAYDLKRFLLESFSILIRDASNFRGLGPGYFRLATQRPEKNGLLINALKEWKMLSY
ncbi:pyridoxal phosphate-dependent aminotransferase [Dyadobacter tibetensis]|uniref:pyridoxal phosphate-dependent aminotransferase n=1 Tax=Dyadobacter tibetensis TaxID=1211851 RepID=UPI00047066C5|nr:aminotransferase class I/II-fold pyridoxal phosphate-dependent enzyme [Dyadobacter tibetensis]